MSRPADRLVRLAARLLPSGVRDRYREEWLADLAGSDEAEVSRGSVVVGAFTTAATIGRTAPEISGLSLDRLFAHRLRIAAALLGGAAVLGAGYAVYGGYASASMAGSGFVAVAGALALVLAAGLATVGLVALVRAVIAAVDAHRLGIAGLLVSTALVVGIGLVAAPDLLAVAAVLAGPIALLTVAALIVMFSTGRGILPTGRRALLASAFGMFAAATCAVGILHVAVWNPLARVPGLTLDEIYAGLDAAQEATGLRAWLIAWPALVGVAVVGFAVLAVAWRRATTRRLVALGFLLIAGTTAVGYLPAFSMGMGLADTFMTTGGDAAATGPLLGILGQAALVAALLVAFLRPPAPVREIVPAPS